MIATPTRRSARWLAVLAVGTLVACNGDGAAGGAGSDDAAGQARLLDLLGRVPASAVDEPGASVSYVDLEVVYARAGLDDDAPPEERNDALGETGRLETFVMPPPLFGQHASQRDEAVERVGFDVTAVARGIEVSAPPRPVTVVVVDTTADDVVAAAEDDALWSDLLAVEDATGRSLLDWGDDLSFDRTGVLHPIGDGGQMLIDGGDAPVTIVRTRVRESMDAVLAVGSDGSLAAMAWATETARLVDGDIIQLVAIPGPPRVTYDAIVVVESIDDGVTTSDVLLVYASDELAADDLDAVRAYATDATMPTTGRPVSEILPDPVVELDGPTIRVASDGAGRFARLIGALYAGDLFPAG